LKNWTDAIQKSGRLWKLISHPGKRWAAFGGTCTGNPLHAMTGTLTGLGWHATTDIEDRKKMPEAVITKLNFNA